jgi:hypothetical protein
MKPIIETTNISALSKERNLESAMMAVIPPQENPDSYT